MVVSAEAWLVLRPKLSSDGEHVRGMTISRMTKSHPALDSDEVAFRMTVRVPPEAFTKPRFYAVVDVPAVAVTPGELEVEVG